MKIWHDIKDAIELAAAKLLARTGSHELATTKPCLACTQLNRVIHGRRRPRCGKCGLPLKEEILT